MYLETNNFLSTPSSRYLIGDNIMRQIESDKKIVLIAIIMLGVCFGLYILNIKSSLSEDIMNKTPITSKINKYVGTEFRLFWIASYMALNNKIEDVYNITAFEEVGKTIY